MLRLRAGQAVPLEIRGDSRTDLLRCGDISVGSRRVALPPHTIIHAQSGSKYKPLASEGDTLDGLNINLCRLLCPSPSAEVEL
jgi:hypothetical protein